MENGLYKQNPNGRRFCNLKHLSRYDIKAIAGKYVQAYMALPDVRNTQIYRIDPELLLEKVLGLNVEYSTCPMTEVFLE